MYNYTFLSFYITEVMPHKTLADMYVSCVDGFMPDKSSKDNDIHYYQLNVVLPITSFQYDCLQFTMQKVD